MTVLIRGESYARDSGTWRPLEIRRPAKLLKDEQQSLRAQLQRDINIDGAYIDRMILNLYTGPGITEVWVDDLEIGPVMEGQATPKSQTPAQTTSRSNVPNATGVTPIPAVQPPRAARVAVEFNREQLYVGGRKYLFRGVRYSDTPLKVLRCGIEHALYRRQSRSCRLRGSGARGLLARADHSRRHSRPRSYCP